MSRLLGSQFLGLLVALDQAANGVGGLGALVLAEASILTPLIFLAGAQLVTLPAFGLEFIDCPSDVLLEPL